jgi:oligopeptide transport system substrate-binding protein
MVEREFKRRKVFEKNPGYRAASEVKLEKFVFLSVEDSQTAFRMYEGGQVHWLYTVPLDQAERVRGRSDWMGAPVNGTYFYVFNTRKKPLDDARVRRALSMAVNREDIVKYILRGGETVAHRLTPPLYPGYEVK